MITRRPDRDMEKLEEKLKDDPAEVYSNIRNYYGTEAKAKL
jgi:hypothetical protein